jgi:NDP-sugar pyrophosphorylase family protein
MKHIDYGLGILSATLFDEIIIGEAFALALLYERLAAKGRLASFEVTDRFFEIGSPSGLREANQHFQEGRG